MKNTTLILCVGLIVGIGALHHLSAQVVVEQPVVSPTYIAVPPVQQEVITTAPAPNYVWVSGHWFSFRGVRIACLVFLPLLLLAYTLLVWRFEKRRKEAHAS